MLEVSVLSLRAIHYWCKGSQEKVQPRGSTLVISTNHSRLQKVPQNFNLLRQVPYNVHQTRKREVWMALYCSCLALFFFFLSPPWLVASCHQLHHCFFSVSPSARWDCGEQGSISAHSAEMQSVICNVFFTFFFSSFNFPIRTLYHRNYRKDPRDAFGLRNTLFPLLSLLYLLDITVLLFILSITK